MHLLRVLHRCHERPLPELRRRIAAAPAPDKEVNYTLKVADADFDCLPNLVSAIESEMQEL